MKMHNDFRFDARRGKVAEPATAARVGQEFDRRCVNVGPDRRAHAIQVPQFRVGKAYLAPDRHCALGQARGVHEAGDGIGLGVINAAMARGEWLKRSATVLRGFNFPRYRTEIRRRYHGRNSMGQAMVYVPRNRNRRLVSSASWRVPYAGNARQTRVSSRFAFSNLNGMGQKGTQAAAGLSRGVSRYDCKFS